MNELSFKTELGFCSIMVLRAMEILGIQQVEKVVGEGVLV